MGRDEKEIWPFHYGRRIMSKLEDAWGGKICILIEEVGGELPYQLNGKDC
jgi:hypothetical protein